MMGENYWLENEHIETDRLLHLLAVTFLFASFGSPFHSVFVTLMGMKRRFLVKTNKKSINLFGEILIPAWYYTMRRQVQNKNKAKSLPNNRRRRWERIWGAAIWMSSWQMICRLQRNLRHVSFIDDNFPIKISVALMKFMRQASRLNHFPH